MASHDPKNDQEFEPIELSLDPEEGGSSWEDMISELEKAEATPAPVRKKPAAPSAGADQPPAPERPAPPAPARPPRKKKQPESRDRAFEDLLIQVNRAMTLVKEFEKRHPYLIAPNIYRAWEEELKETSVTMTREFHRLRERNPETPSPSDQ